MEAMPLENRVDPYGRLFRTPARGTMMGNRGGALHNHEREIVRQYMDRRWIACVLEFRGRRREVMSPGRYTELFFLDEAVSLAAGHRPCAECRRERYNAFREAWRRGQGGGEAPRAGEMDVDLHRARVDRQGRKVTYEAELDSLPNGCFVEMERAPFLVWDDSLMLWMPEGYARKHLRPDGLRVTVLTPRPIVECLRQGYVAGAHRSSGATPVSGT
jgi:hypothetical protein